MCVILVGCPYRRHLVKLFAQAKVFFFEGGHCVCVVCECGRCVCRSLFSELILAKLSLQNGGRWVKEGLGASGWVVDW